METYRTKWRGYKVTVFFTGAMYIFTCDWCGVFAVATRSWENYQTEKAHFQLEVGNDDLLGGSLGSDYVLTLLCERFIRKCENKWIEKEVSFEVSHRDHRGTYITVTVKY